MTEIVPKIVGARSCRLVDTEHTRVSDISCLMDCYYAKCVYKKKGPHDVVKPENSRTESHEPRHLEQSSSDKARRVQGSYYRQRISPYFCDN